MKNHSLSSNDRFLLICAKPAPNGGLHLGHIAGPYLRQDMLRRHYALRGASVATIGGTDPVDSFIALRATQDDQRPDHVAAQYFEQIRQDFASYDIHFDAFIDPLAPEWRDRYIGCFADVVDRVVADGRAEEETRDFPFVQGEDRGASGAWLCGECPDCGLGVSGYFCESCGAHFEPDEVVRPTLRGGGAMAFAPTKDIFFRLRDTDGLVESLERMGVAPPLRAIVSRQFERGRARVRLTERSDWGIPVDKAGVRRFFGHGLLYGYCRLLGEVYNEVTGESVNPFDAASDVISINLFGIDNTVSHMVNIQAIGHETDGWKGFDGFVVNRFYLLEGKKFSTSARHLVWAQDLIHTAGADADGVRFVISAGSPTHAERDLKVDEFLHQYNDVFLRKIRARVGMDVSALHGHIAAAPHEAVAARFESLWTRACEGHVFAAYAPEEQVELLLAWMDARTTFADRPETLHAWLKCLCLLLYPIAPRLGAWTWTALGLPGLPSLSTIDVSATVDSTHTLPDVAPLDAEAMYLAMPERTVEHARRAALSAVPA